MKTAAFSFTIAVALAFAQASDLRGQNVMAGYSEDPHHDQGEEICEHWHSNCNSVCAQESTCHNVDGKMVCKVYFFCFFMRASSFETSKQTFFSLRYNAPCSILPRSYLHIMWCPVRRKNCVLLGVGLPRWSHRKRDLRSFPQFLRLTLQSRDL